MASSAMLQPFWRRCLGGPSVPLDGQLLGFDVQ
uniref:Uncharacterized protein n=1 Tax=Arundo donax TaxID=35708 RepID=A0A0A9BI70_ARUDO